MMGPLQNIANINSEQLINCDPFDSVAINVYRDNNQLIVGYNN